MVSKSGGFQGFEKRVDDPSHEKGVKEHEGRSDNDRPEEEPAGGSAAQMESSFCQSSGALKEEIGGGQSESATGGNRDHQFVSKTRKAEPGHRSGSGTEAPNQGAKYRNASDFTEGTIPAFAPEFGQRPGSPWGIHDRANMETATVPEGRSDFEEAEMKCQENSGHSEPAAENGRIDCGDHQTDEDQARRRSCQGTRKRNSSGGPFLDKSAGIHSDPGGIAEASDAKRSPASGFQPGDHFKSSPKRSGEQPHPKPGGHILTQEGLVADPTLLIWNRRTRQPGKTGDQK